MVRTIKPLLVGTVLALTMLGGALIAPHEVAAYQKVFRSDDGKVVFVCYYDDRTNELAYCDVQYFPVKVQNGTTGTE